MVPRKNYIQSFEELLLVDIDDSGSLQVNRQRFTDLSAIQISSLLTLRQRSSKRSPFTTRQRHRRRSEFCLQRDLKEVLSSVPIERSLVVIGSSFDPFSAAGSRFQLGVEVLKLLAKARPAALCVQTSSPLVMLATPILRSLGDRAAVTMAIQACSSEFAAQQTAATARPEERLETVRTLRSVGITTILQLSPITDRNSVISYVQTVAKTADYAIIADAYADSKLCEQVRMELIRRAPQMLLENICEIWTGMEVESEAA